MYIEAMIYWNVEPHMKRKGWANAHQLALGAKLNVQTAYNVLSREPVERISATLLERLAKSFGLKSPWALLRYEP